MALFFVLYQYFLLSSYPIYSYTQIYVFYERLRNNQMTVGKPFQKGNSGKPKGAKSKRTVEAIKRVEWVIGMLEETIESDVKRLKPPQRVQLWNDLQEYVRPKLARQDLKIESDSQIKITVVRKSK
jgi:hypothetical protein